MIARWEEGFPKVISTSLTQRAYTRIFHEIFSGALPAGSRVSEMELAERLDIGRMPVREAIRQLQSEGLMEQVHRRGTFVRQFNLQEILDLYELREALEPYAVAKAVKQIDANGISMLESLCEEMHSLAVGLQRSGFSCLEGETRQRHLTVDMTFHLILIRAGGNQPIAQAVARSKVILRIFLAQAMVFSLPFLAQAYRFHRRILRAVKRRDPEAARDWTARHIRTGMEQISNLCSVKAEEQEAEQVRSEVLPENVLQQMERLQQVLETGH